MEVLFYCFSKQLSHTEQSDQQLEAVFFLKKGSGFQKNAVFSCVVKEVRTLEYDLWIKLGCYSCQGVAFFLTLTKLSNLKLSFLQLAVRNTLSRKIS